MPKKKLTEEQVLDIRQRFYDGERNISKFSREFCVSRATIENLLRGKTFKYVDGKIWDIMPKNVGRQPSLDEHTIRLIREKYKKGEEAKEIADELSIRHPMVANIIKGKSYKFFDGPVVERIEKLGGRGKLTLDQIEEIKILRSNGSPVKFIAEKFNLHYSTVYRILDGTTYGKRMARKRGLI